LTNEAEAFIVDKNTWIYGVGQKNPQKILISGLNRSLT
jgi:hypothetical protein